MAVALSLARVVQGGLWLYIDTLFTNFLGYLYWLLISRMAGPEAVGLASATMALCWLTSQIILLGVPTGVQRFFGMVFGSNKLPDLKKYLGSSLLMAGVANSIGVVALFAGSRFGLLDIEYGFLVVAAAIIILYGFTSILFSLFISALRTSLTAFIHMVASVLKFIVGVSLVYIGWGGFGATMGFLFMYVVSLISLCIGLRAMCNPISLEFSYTSFKEVLFAGLASWLPDLFNSMGSWLGVLVIFGFQGSIETGHYYVAFAIAGLVTAISQSVLSLMFPILSGMSDGRKRASWKAIKFTLIFASPLMVLLALYPYVPLSLLGENYVTASSQLRILAFSVPFIALYTGVWSLTYAYGFYKAVLALGIAQNIPRVVIYFLLAPSLGGTGAALGFLIGSLTGALAAMIMTGTIEMRLNWSNLAITLATPSIAGFLLALVNLPWYVGSILVLAVSALSYTWLGVISRDELRDLMLALLPDKVIRYMKPHVSILTRVLFGD